MVVDSTQIYILEHGSIYAKTITGQSSGTLGPGESPSWSIEVTSHGESTPGEWNFLISDTWMREIDGTPHKRDSTRVDECVILITRSDAAMSSLASVSHGSAIIRFLFLK